MTPTLPAPYFEALVREHHAEVYRSARRIVVNDADALDVTQQVFLRVLEGTTARGTSQERGRALRWLAARTALAQLRGARNRRDKEDQYAMERCAERPENEATRQEARQELRRQLARLPDELRTALVLRFQEDWTFAQIASEQSCSEPSAHDRVQRGLERLRGELSRLGFAGFAAALPGELAREAGELALPLPEGLEHGLLNLRAPLALSASAKLASGLFALISIVAVAGAAVWWPKNTSADRGVSATAQATSPSVPELAAPVPTQDRKTALPGSSLQGALQPGERSTPALPAGVSSGVPTGTISGRFVDSNRAPIAAVLVFANTLAHDNKFPRFSLSALSENDGRFELQVPVSTEGGEEYILTTRHLDFVPHTREQVLARVGTTNDVGEIALLRSSHDEAGDATLEVFVQDSAGAPVANTAVTAFRSVGGPDGVAHEESEALARTDGFGRAVLSLKRLGSKRLYVYPPPGELCPASVTIGIDASARFERTIRLEKGLTISGTILGIGGDVVHGRGGFLAAVGDPDLAWINADIDDQSGTFVLRGLEDRSYTLVRDGDGWSRAELHDVRAGTAGLAIQLKRKSDLRDIGDHQAELHGEVRDARTGSVLSLAAFAISVEYPGDIRGLDWNRDVLPGLITPRPVQTLLSGDYVPPSAFHLDGLAPGTYAISARLAGYAPAFAGPFELVEHDMRTGIVIEVEPPATVRGVLVDPTGRPLANGFMLVTGSGEKSLELSKAADLQLRATRGEGAIGVWGQVRTAADGSFKLSSLPAWPGLRVVAHHPDFEMSLTEALVLHPGETTDLGRVTSGARIVR